MKKIVTLALFLIAFSSIAISQITDLQKNSLIDLYNSTNGDQWNTSWDLNENPTSWYGVTIENDLVIAINLSMNNLSGSIPNSINNLTALQHLNLGFNKLTGKIPSELTTIQSLETLQLFMNRLEGEIPSNIGALVN
jgi:hypothetical protein